MTKGLLIVGAGGNGRVAADIALRMGHWNSVAFVDDRLQGQSVMNLPVVCAVSEMETLHDQYSDVFISIAHASTYLDLKAKIIKMNFDIPTLIHPSSVIADSAIIGLGSMICARAVINPLAVIGSDNIINTGAIIEHDCVLGMRTHMAPGAILAGNVHIGNHCWIGLGSRVNENLSICNQVKIGSGTVVVKSITKPGTYVGVPAKPITVTGQSLKN